LLAESQVFEEEILTRAEDATNPANKVPEGGDHGPKSYRIASNT
jgi:hypothetical protein